MIIIIGTIHETKNETTIFKLLNKYTNQMDNLFWLCEGESDNRQCKSLKDYDIHVITDALFVNMLCIDIKNTKIKDISILTMLYDRIIELFITIKRLSGHNNTILSIFDNNIYYKNINKLSHNTISQGVLKDIESDLMTIDINVLMNDMQNLTEKIIKLMMHNNKINKRYHNCILKFFQTGSQCEDVILTDMREHSFLLKTVSFIIENDVKHPNKKNIYAITVGRDHVNFLKEKILLLETILKNVDIRTMYI